MPTVAVPIALSVFAFSMMHALISDLTTMTIKNRLVLFLVVTYTILAPSAGMPWISILHSLVAAAAVLASGFVLFQCNRIGGGDVKLAAATALWLGAEHTPAYLVYAALLGGVLSLVLLTFRFIKLPGIFLGKAWISRLHSKGAPVPYGIALALAGLAVLPTTRWMALL